MNTELSLNYGKLRELSKINEPIAELLYSASRDFVQASSDLMRYAREVTRTADRVADEVGRGMTSISATFMESYATHLLTANRDRDLAAKKMTEMIYLFKQVTGVVVEFNEVVTVAAEAA